MSWRILPADERRNGEHGVILEITERLSEPAEPRATLTLPFDLRQKSRLRTRLDDGREVGLFLPRGPVLRAGDLLRASNQSQGRDREPACLAWLWIPAVLAARTDNPSRARPLPCPPWPWIPAIPAGMTGGNS